jgi:hypothetical protein
MNIAPATASSGGTSPARRVPRPLHWFFTAAIAVIGSVVAVTQSSRPDALSSPTPLSVAWWQYPRERNAFKRLHGLTARLNSVYALRGTGQIWAVGNGGLLIHSRDDGRTWRQDSIVATLAPPVEAPEPAAPTAQSQANIDTTYGGKSPPYACPPCRTARSASPTDNPPAMR